MQEGVNSGCRPLRTVSPKREIDMDSTFGVLDAFAFVVFAVFIAVAVTATVSRKF